MNCNSTYMGFHVAKGLLRPFVIGDFLHLNDPTCRVQEDDDFYSLTWRLDQCQNEINFTANSTYVSVLDCGRRFMICDMQGMWVHRYCRPYSDGMIFSVPGKGQPSGERLFAVFNTA